MNNKYPLTLAEQLSNFTNEGNPNDHQTAQVVKQAIKDDQALAPIAEGIDVSVTNGTITLNGQVDTNQQMNLASNTAKALAVVEKVKNNLSVTQNGLSQ